MAETYEVAFITNAMRVVCEETFVITEFNCQKTLLLSAGLPVGPLGSVGR